MTSIFFIILPVVLYLCHYGHVVDVAGHVEGGFFLVLECVVTQWRLLAVELGFDVVVVEVLAVDGVSLGGKEAAAGLGGQDWASAAVLC